MVSLDVTIKYTLEMLFEVGPGFSHMVLRLENDSIWPKTMSIVDTDLKLQYIQIYLELNLFVAGRVLIAVVF